jgi:soluble lytic murein transglycosylase-like protein
MRLPIPTPMRASLPAILCFGALALGRAEDPYQNARKLAEQSAELQLKSVALMQESVSRQTAASLAAPPPRSAGESCAPLADGEVDSLVRNAATEQRLDPLLLRAVIRQESSFQPCAVSSKGAMGLMQLMPGTAAQLGVDDAFNAQENITAGAKYLRMLLDRYDGRLPLALGAYNAGPARVDAHGSVPPIPETRNYVVSILNLLGQRAGFGKTTGNQVD